MAKASGGGKVAGVSPRTKDAIQTGLFMGGKCTLTFEYGIFDYKASGKHPALIVTFEDENGEKNEEPYGLGKGWDISRDGTKLIPKNGQTGLPNSCDAILYMFTPLEDALDAANVPFPAMEDGDITELNGLEAVVARKPVQARDFGDARKRDASKGPQTKLVVTEVLSAPWAEDAKPTRGAKSKKKDDDEDEAPARGRAAGKANGKARDDDEGDDEIDTLAKEALLEAIEDEGGPLSVDDLEAAVLAQLKGNPQRKAIASRAAQPAFLAECEGVIYNSRKGTVAAG